MRDTETERGEGEYLSSVLSTLLFGKFYLLSENKKQILHIFFECYNQYKMIHMSFKNLGKCS